MKTTRLLLVDDDPSCDSKAVVGRPDSTDPDRVSSYVLGRFSEPRDAVEGLIASAAGEAERLVAQLAAGPAGEEDET